MNDYKYHKLELDVSGRKDVDDGTLHIIANAQVRWKELNLTDTSVYMRVEGLEALSKGCPDMLVRSGI